MHFTTLASCLLALAVLVAGQTGVRYGSANENCSIFQVWPDPAWPGLGNTCAEIADTWSTDVQDFIDRNPAVGENCDNLVEGNEYCVLVDEDSTEEEEDDEEGEDDEEEDGEEDGEDGYEEDDEEDDEEISEDDSEETPEDDLGEPDFKSGIQLDSNVPDDFSLEDGALDGENGRPITGDDCTHVGPGYQDCLTMANFWSISEKDFIAMNPSVGKSCSSLTFGKTYCVQAHTHPDLDASTTPDCTQHIFYPDPSRVIRKYQGQTCKSFTDSLFVRVEDFLQWNPVVGKECEGFKEGRRYCFWVDGVRSYYDHLFGNETLTPVEEAAATATAKSGGGSAAASSESEDSSPADENAASNGFGGGLGTLAFGLCLVCLGCSIMW